MKSDPFRSNSLTVLAAQIQKEYGIATKNVRNGLSHAIRCGELLLEAKAQIKHGSWLPWLKKSCVIPQSTANLYMRLAKSKCELLTLVI
jgi:hypothetical protein